jgi:hypothetical protein
LERFLMAGFDFGNMGNYGGQPGGYQVGSGANPLQMDPNALLNGGQGIFSPQLDASGITDAFNPANALKQYTMPQMPGAVAAPGGGSWWDGILGSTDADGNKTQGWGGLALGAATGIGNLWMGGKQLKMADKSLKESKRQFNVNNANQTQTVNTQLEDRQRARVSADPNAYESVGSYMDKHRVGAA